MVGQQRRADLPSRLAPVDGVSLAQSTIMYKTTPDFLQAERLHTSLMLTNTVL